MTGNGEGEIVSFYILDQNGDEVSVLEVEKSIVLDFSHILIAHFPMSCLGLKWKMLEE